MRIFNTLQRADIQVLSLVASHGREHQICIRAGIDHVDICSSTIEISSIESIIEPVYTPLILVSHPPHDGRQARECRDTPVEAVVVPCRFYDDWFTLNISMHPHDNGKIAGDFIGA